MTPAVSIDMTADIDTSLDTVVSTPSSKLAPQSATTATPTTITTPLHRTLLLSPPSLSSHPLRLNAVLEAHDRSATDIQMLDRLALGLVSLPSFTYDLVLVLTDADGTRAESQSLLDRRMFSAIAAALKPGAVLRAQDDGFFGESVAAEETREAILAGLVVEGGVARKPMPETGVSVPLRRSKPQGGPVATTLAVGTGVEELNANGKRANANGNGEHVSAATPAGVGFVDFTDDLDAAPEIDSDDELIDEDTLLDEADLARPVVQRTYTTSNLDPQALYHPSPNFPPSYSYLSQQP